MSYEVWEVLRQTLINDSTIKNLVGSRVFPVIAPKNTSQDYIVYAETSDSIAGSSAFCGDMTIRRKSITYAAFSSSIISSDRIRNRVASILNRNNAISGVEFVLQTGTENAYDADSELYMSAVTFDVTYDSSLVHDGQA